jgi:uncharacterized protein YjiK
MRAANYAARTVVLNRKPSHVVRLQQPFSSAEGLTLLFAASLSISWIVRPAPIRGQAPAGSAAAAQGALSRYAIEGPEPTQFELPRNLREVSGLATGDRGRVFAHQDERGLVFELDPKSGKVIKAFRLGANGVRGDFEGIAVVGQRMFLVSSEGVLFEFREPAADASASYQQYELAVRNRCAEIEGLDYDARNNELLLACKITRGAEQRDRLIVFAFSLRSMSTVPAPRFSIPLTVLRQQDLEPELHPSGLAVHPQTGTIFVIASQQNLIVEFGRDGQLLGTARLRKRTHAQPEGITFGSDGTLYIADEAGSARAALTAYPQSPSARARE